MQERPSWFVAIYVGIAILMPFFSLLAYAHLTSTHGIGWLPIIAAGLLGLAMLSLTPISAKARFGIAIIYAIAAFFILPFFALLAECSTGNCL